MQRSVIAGAWYGDFLTTGEYCATIPGVGLITHLGNVGLPPGEPWGIGYPRCTAVNGFRVAGQAHTTLSPACWEFDPAAGGWVPYGPPCVGVSPVIYDNDGVLHRSDGSIGSQGYRYVTPQNQLISGDATYGPFHGLFEYTDLGGLWIGQAAYDGGGVQVWDGAVLRQLEIGTTTFVRANRAGDAVALAFTRSEGVVLISTTMAELRALPPVVKPPDPPIDPPPPDHPDEPDEPDGPDEPPIKPPKPQPPYQQIKPYRIGG